MPTFTNPILPGTHPDPSICRVGSDYYLVTSSFEYFPGVPIFHSTDLVNWRQIGHVLDRKSQLDFSKNLYPQDFLPREVHGVPTCSGIWAPTIRYHNGTFYMITTQVGGIGNFFVTAKDPAGPWSDPILVDVETFDPSLFFDDDGRAYYTRRGPGGILQAEIDVHSGKLMSKPRVVVEKYICADIEGPHLYKIHGKYYLMAAEGGTRFGHAEVIGRSSSPWGPFEPCPHNPLITHRDQGHSSIRDTGHADLVEDAQGNWWLVCLGTRHTHYNSASILGRETFMAPVRWVDGWPVVEQRTIPTAFETDLLPEPAPRLTSWRDDFDRPSLDFAWNTVLNLEDAAWSLSEKPGCLRLKGLPVTLEDIAAPAFFGRRQDQFNVTARCQVSFTPTAVNEEAGLAVYINNYHHYALAVTNRNAQPCVVLKKQVGDITQEIFAAPLSSPEVQLGVTCDGTRYHFFYGEADRPAGSGLCRLLSPETSGEDCVWTGVYLGLYASGNGQHNHNPADFD